MNKRYLILIFIVSIMATGCMSEKMANTPVNATTTQPPQPTSQPTQTPLPLPQNGGQLNLSMRMPKTLNPLLNEDETIDSVLRLVFEPLMIIDDSFRAVPNPHLVESIVFDPTLQLATVVLKQNIAWSDGTEISASDVVFTLKALQAAPEGVIYKKQVENIQTLLTINKKTLTIAFSKPYGAISYALCVPIVPEHYYRNEKTPNSAKNMAPLGNGRYRFMGYTPSVSLALSASETSICGRPYIDNIEVLVLKDASADFYAFDQRIIDTVVSDVSNWGHYGGGNSVTKTQYIGLTFDYIGFHAQKPLFQKISVRQAIAYAIPIDNIHETVYSSYGAKSATSIHPNSWLFDSTATHLPFNLEQAKELLQGCEDAVVILVNEENAQRVAVANILSNNLNGLGLSAKVVSLPFSEFLDRMNKGEYDLFLGGFHVEPNGNVLSFFENSVNDSFETEALQLAKYQVANAISEDEQKVAAMALSQCIANELPFIGLVFRGEAFFTNERILGNISPLPAQPYKNLEQWYIAPTP